MNTSPTISDDFTSTAELPPTLELPPAVRYPGTLDPSGDHPSSAAVPTSSRLTLGPNAAPRAIERTLVPIQAILPSRPSKMNSPNTSAGVSESSFIKPPPGHWKMTHPELSTKRWDEDGNLIVPVPEDFDTSQSLQQRFARGRGGRGAGRGGRAYGLCEPTEPESNGPRLHGATPESADKVRKMYCSNCGAQVTSRCEEPQKQRQISRLFEGLAADSTARATRPNRAAPVVIRCQDSCLQPITELLFRRQPQETDSLER